MDLLQQVWWLEETVMPSIRMAVTRPDKYSHDMQVMGIGAN